MKRWEYCVITGANGSFNQFEPSRPQLIFFSQRGIEKVLDLSDKAQKDRPSGWKDVSEAGYVAHTIAQLGQEGWEMVSAVPGGTQHTSGTGATSLYFRRAIE